MNEPCVIQGRLVPPELVAAIEPVSWHDVERQSLPRMLQDNGHLLIRGVYDEVEIQAVREEVFSRLVEVDEIAEPAADGIYTGKSRRRELVDLGEFWRSVSYGQALRRVSHGEKSQAVMSAVLGQPAIPHDYIFLRPSVVGRSTQLHYDRPFFARGSSAIVTAWTALGDIPCCDGPLVVVEGSHRFDDLLGPIEAIDYDSKDAPQVQMKGDAVDFALERGSRLLTAHFQPGDIVIFTMTLLHGTFDNCSPLGRTRLSCDVRWQPAIDEVDPRYRGENPPGTTGIGYAELNGAKPLTEPWHVR